MDILLLFYPMPWPIQVLMLPKFIIKACIKSYTQVTWKDEVEGKIFTIAIRDSSLRVIVESKSPSSVSLNASLDLLISNFNKMDSFAYDSSHSFLFERFAFSKDENKETIPKKLMKEGEDHER